MKYLLPFFCLLLFCLPGQLLAAPKQGEPLTLLKQPQKNAISMQNPQLPNSTAGLTDIYPPVELKQKGQPLLYAGLAALAIVLIFALVMLLKKWQNRKIKAIAPWDKAILELNQAKELLGSDKGLQYMDKVSLILRSYVESRFAISSTRQTTTEFLLNLNNSTADPKLSNYKSELQTCLEQCDMAKFAHLIPRLQNMKMVENAIISFVEKTKPTPGQRGGAA